MHALGHVGFEISGSVAISGNVGHRLLAEGLKGEGVNQKSRVFSADCPKDSALGHLRGIGLGK